MFSFSLQNLHRSNRHVFHLMHTLAGTVLLAGILNVVVRTGEVAKRMSQRVQRTVSLFLHIDVCCWIKIPSCNFSNSSSDAAAKESTVGYPCLFSLPSFVCSVKVLLSIIMNHFFFFFFHLVLIYSHGWR